MTKPKRGGGSLFIRSSRETPFVQIDKRPIRDPALSWKAKGLLAYLLSLPDDWRISAIELQNHARDGEDSTLAGVNELIENGYITRTPIRQGGKFSGYEYRVFETPLPIPKRENPDTVKPSPNPAFPGLEKPNPENPGNTDNVKTDNVKTDKEAEKNFPEKNEIEEKAEEPGGGAVVAPETTLQIVEPETPTVEVVSSQDAPEAKKTRGKKELFRFDETNLGKDFFLFADRWNETEFSKKYSNLNLPLLWEKILAWSQAKGERRKDWLAVGRTFVLNNPKEFTINANGNRNSADKKLADTYRDNSGGFDWAGM